MWSVILDYLEMKVYDGRDRRVRCGTGGLGFHDTLSVEESLRDDAGLATLSTGIDEFEESQTAKRGRGQKDEHTR